MGSLWWFPVVFCKTVHLYDEGTRMWINEHIVSFKFLRNPMSTIPPIPSRPIHSVEFTEWIWKLLFQNKNNLEHATNFMEEQFWTIAQRLNKQIAPKATRSFPLHWDLALLGCRLWWWWWWLWLVGGVSECYITN